MTSAGDAWKRAADTAADAVDRAARASGPLLDDATTGVRTAARDPASSEELAAALEAALRDGHALAAAYGRRRPVAAVLWSAGAGAVAMALVRLLTVSRAERRARRARRRER